MDSEDDVGDVWTWEEGHSKYSRVKNTQQEIISYTNQELKHTSEVTTQ